ncbi:MAG: phosphotriesterase [Oscillospiraceae bacterium]|nr:phosphotriesterase [Oscillospiraceae bacterium]
MRYVQTVRGTIAPEEMGFTLHHEHIFWDLDIYLPKDLDIHDETDPRNDDISLENLSQVRSRFQQYPKNVIQTDIGIAEKELLWFKEAGGRTICDCTVRGIGPRPQLLKEVSMRTGMNILAGTGYYCYSAVTEEENELDRYEKAEHMLRDLRLGFDGTDVKAGFIKVGVQDVHAREDRESLAAAAIAQKETGAPILIHQPGLEHQSQEIFDVLTANGGALDRVVMCHCDPLLPDLDYIDAIAKAGAYISFDFFGLDGVLGKTLFLPTDKDRIFSILELIDRGDIEKLVISHDTVYKTMLRQFGGYGYAHIQKDVWPLMLANGYTQDILDQISIKNPKEIFSLEA